MDFRLLAVSVSRTLMRPVRAALCCAMGAVLAACAVAPKEKAEAAAAKFAVLAMVEVRNEQNAAVLPARLVMQVEAEDGRRLDPLVLDAQTRLPGVDASFALRMELPAGRYRIVRIAGTTAKSGRGAQFDIDTRITFEAGARPVAYLGNLQVMARPRGPQDPPMASPLAAADAVLPGFADATAVLAVSDRLMDDWPGLVQAWPALRGQTLETQLAQVQPSSGAVVQAAQTAQREKAAPQAPVSGRMADPVRLSVDDGRALPPAARAAFARFIGMRLPRAMALSGKGAVTLASGADAVTSALARCRRQAGKSGCRLVAVDDTLLDANLAGAQASAAPEPAR